MPEQNTHHHPMIPLLPIAKKHIKHVYTATDKFSGTFDFAKQLGHHRITYYSYGRWALFQALQSLQVGPKHLVLVPDFICRDLLAAIHATGANIAYYSVNPDLSPVNLPHGLSGIKAVIAVNYFGFAQDLDVFRTFCKTHDATLIEDNAHGLFSCDAENRFLGNRGDIGIFSLRKTLPLFNGAALSINNANLAMPSPLPSDPNCVKQGVGFSAKTAVRCLAGLLGPAFPLLLVSGARKIRKMRFGHEILPSCPGAEQELPAENQPWCQLSQRLRVANRDNEAQRRRELYLCLESFTRQLPLTPVFESLPQNVVPYVFPFRANAQDMDLINNTLRKIHLECFRWPELPNAIIDRAPDHYKQVWCVNFLW